MGQHAASKAGLHWQAQGQHALQRQSTVLGGMLLVADFDQYWCGCRHCTAGLRVSGVPLSTLSGGPLLTAHPAGASLMHLTSWQLHHGDSGLRADGLPGSMEPAALCASGRALLGRRLKPPQSVPSASLGASAVACSRHKPSLRTLCVYGSTHSESNAHQDAALAPAAACSHQRQSLHPLEVLNDCIQQYTANCCPAALCKSPAHRKPSTMVPDAAQNSSATEHAS